MEGEAAEVVEAVGVAAEGGEAGVAAAVAPGRSHGFGGEAMASNAGEATLKRKNSALSGQSAGEQSWNGQGWDWSEGRMRRTADQGVLRCPTAGRYCACPLWSCPVGHERRKVAKIQASSISEMQSLR